MKLPFRSRVRTAYVAPETGDAVCVRAAHPTKILRHPILHFFLIGALLFAGKQWLPSGPDDELQIISVSAADLQRLRGEWTREIARVPSDSELQASVQRHIDEELLLHEALQLGLEASDPVARERLVMNMRFAFPESGKNDGQLLSEARALGMHTRDLVVRRRLVQIMEMRLASQANVSERELREYVAAHPERYTQPARYAFRHLFFSADRPQGQALRMAQARLAELRAQDADAAAGDPFLLGSVFAPQTESEIARHFGAEFAQALIAMQPGHWSGLLRSPYGVHLVMLEHIEPAASQDFERVSERAAYAYLAEREKQMLRDELARLRLNYRVELPHG